MTGLPVEYRKGGETAVASYNYVDIAEGTGVVTYYGFMSSDNTYGLTTSSEVYSDRIYSSGASVSSGGFTLGTDLDFDVEFNLPKTIKGDAIVIVPQALLGTTDAKTYIARPDVILYKYDGSTETEIASASGAAWEMPADQANDYDRKVNSLKLDVPLTHFKKGEILRINVRSYAMTKEAADTCWSFIGHSPQARTQTYFGTESTKLVANIPFRLDL